MLICTSADSVYVSWSEVKSYSVVSDSLWPHGYSDQVILQARILEWIVIPFSRESFQPRDRTQISHVADRFFTSWATREAQEYWSGSLSLLQGIFLTQESNWVLLHYRQILHQLSYKWSSCTHPTVYSNIMTLVRNWIYHQKMATSYLKIELWPTICRNHPRQATYYL